MNFRNIFEKYNFRIRKIQNKFCFFPFYYLRWFNFFEIKFNFFLSFSIIIMPILKHSGLKYKRHLKIIIHFNNTIFEEIVPKFSLKIKILPKK